MTYNKNQKRKSLETGGILMRKGFLRGLVLVFAALLLCGYAPLLSYGAEADMLLKAPTFLVAENREKGAEITWSQVEGAEGYILYRTEGKKEPTVLYKGDESTLTYTDKTAVSGTLYSYSVRAYNASGEGDESPELSHTYLAVPTVISASNGYGGIEVKWKKTSGAESYTVYRKNGSSKTLLAEVSAEKGCIYFDKTAKEGKKYQYGVVANCGGCKSACVYGTSSLYVKAPEVKSVTNQKDCIKISWAKTDGAEKYTVYRRAADGEWKSLKALGKNVTSYNDSDVKSGTVYSYRVVAAKGGSKSGCLKEGTKCKYLSQPQNVTVTNKDFNGCLIKWDKVSGAESYKLYRKDGKDSQWKELTTVKGTSYKDTTAKNAQEYTYRVRAYSGSYKSVCSGSVKGLCVYAPKSVSLTCTTGGVTVKWTKTSVGDGYRIYRKEVGETSSKLIRKVTSASTTSYTDTEVTSGKSYVYTVKVTKGSVQGSYKKGGYTVKYTPAPSLTLSHSPTGVVLKWNKSSVGTGYEIQRKAQGESEYKTIATVKKQGTVTYTDKKPVYGKYNYYRIKVIYGKSVISTSQKIFGIDPKKKLVALTYDDGPKTEVTNSILETLKKHNSRATFFVVGSRVDTYKDCLIQADKQGCEIGNHTYNHTYLTSVSEQTINSEINLTNKAIEKVIGKTPKLVRTPGGSVNGKVKSTVNYPLINWNVDTLDWKYRSSSSVISNVKANVRDGSIVLMHDLYGTTASATKEIVPWLIKNGYQLVTVSELMAVKGVSMKPGTVYYCG